MVGNPAFAHRADATRRDDDAGLRGMTVDEASRHRTLIFERRPAAEGGGLAYLCGECASPIDATLPFKPDTPIAM